MASPRTTPGRSTTPARRSSRPTRRLLRRHRGRSRARARRRGVAVTQRQRDLRVAADRPAVPDRGSRHLPPDRRGLGPRPGARLDRHDARRERRSSDKQAVMLSIPRDISNFPLYSGGRFRGKINSLMTAATNDPKRFPDGPVLTLTREIGYLIGVPINYYAAINLNGFQKMVDLVGGVDIDNPRWINDPLYDWFDGTSGFRLSAGHHHLDGRKALAYVRSRQGAGDSDFTRAARQQQVLVGTPGEAGHGRPAGEAAGSPQGRSQEHPDRFPARPGPRVPGARERRLRQVDRAPRPGAAVRGPSTE